MKVRSPERRLLALGLLALAACEDGIIPDPPVDPDFLRFGVMPIGGVMNDDWYLTFYRDAVAGAGIGDHSCGPKSYDGHQGTDLVLRSFVAMDAGVAVLAAADGTVTFVHDGEFDRQTEWTDAEWNVVVVAHDDRVDGVYGHLMKNSIRVAAGEAVRAGDTLGLVGSSGRSDMPHLHFEVREDGRAVEPFAGPCGPSESRWADQIGYQDDFHLIDAAVTTTPLDLAVVKGPPAAATELGAGSVLYSWIHLHNAEDGAPVDWTLRRPDGSVSRTFHGEVPEFYSMSWWWYWTTIEDGAPAGEWTMEFRVGGSLVASRTFAVTPAAALAAARGPGVREGWSGGGLR